MLNVLCYCSLSTHPNPPFLFYSTSIAQSGINHRLEMRHIHICGPHELPSFTHSFLSCDRWPWTHHPATKNRLYHNLSTQMALPVSSSWFLLPEVTTILNPVLNILLLFSLYIIISPICTPKTYVTILVVFKFLEKGGICTIKITLLLYFILIVVYVPLGAYTTVY